MKRSLPGPPPMPGANLSRRHLPIIDIAPGTLLIRIHRSKLAPLHFGRHADPVRRQRWDAPDSSYGVCYFAFDGHVAFAETLLRETDIEEISESSLAVRAMNLTEVVEALRLVDAAGAGLHRIGADASVVHAQYDVTQAWSAALHAHPDCPDGIRYRARHDDSGFSVALFDRAAGRLRPGTSIGLLDPSMTSTLADWLHRYNLGLAS